MTVTIDFRDQAVIVTGAGGGLGRLYALDLARRGAAVVVNDVGADVTGSGSDPSRAEAVVREIEEMGGRAVADAHSVADAAGGEAIVQTALDVFGRLDAVVNNAGILSNRAFLDVAPEDLDDMLNVHLKGAFFVSQPAFRAMRDGNGGRFVFISSSAGVFGLEQLSHYGAAKTGVLGLANVIGIEGQAHGIRANCVMPFGYTRMVPAHRDGAAPNPVNDRFLASTLPEKVVPVVSYLASRRCALNHFVFSAGAGRYARAFIGLTEGWLAEPGRMPSAEDIEAHLDEITDATKFWIPMSIMDEVAEIIRRRGLADPDAVLD
jgi:NAD(P)-dependent dehydrogenase (short-subunit alcohol dehydrogenase family)